MPLKDIERELYKEKSDIEKREHGKTDFNIDKSIQSESGQFQEDTNWEKSDKGIGSYQKKIIIFSAIFIGIGAILALAFWGVTEFRKSAFDESNVSIEIDGPDKVDSIQLVRYKIKYSNNNRVSLKNAEIQLNYPEHFQIEDSVNLNSVSKNSSKIYIGDIDSFSEGEIEFSGRFYAPEDYSVTISSSLNYVPSNFNSKFTADNRKTVNTKSSPILLEIDAPIEAFDGNLVEYVISYKNISSKYFSNLRMEVIFSDEFEFEHSEPSPSEGENFWYLGNLGENEKGEIRIKGKIGGSKNEAKIIQVSIGTVEDNGFFLSYGQRDRSTRIVISPLSISQTVNGSNKISVNEGEMLNYKLKFSNDGDIGLRNVIITCELDGDIFDFSSIMVGDTSFESSTNTITWKAVDVSQLANLQPGQEGVIEFSIPILKNVSIENIKDKNFTVSSIAKIDSPDVPTPIGVNKIIYSDKLELKLNTSVSLDTNIFYPNSPIENFGPMPPQVGKETSLTLQWQISNTFNDISGVKVESALPTGVRWIDKIYPDGEKLSFNERTNKIVWDIGNIKSGVGIIEPKKEVSFQVSIVPEIRNIGNTVEILSASKMVAKDEFTGKDFLIESSGISTKLLEKTGVLRENTEVIESIE